MSTVTASGTSPLPYASPDVPEQIVRAVRQYRHAIRDHIGGDSSLATAAEIEKLFQAQNSLFAHYKAYSKAVVGAQQKAISDIK